MIGFNLGAHIAGFRIGKVIGLDPAGPLFDINDPRTRLDASDAIHVIALHTSDYFGIRRSVATVD